MQCERTVRIFTVFFASLVNNTPASNEHNNTGALCEQYY